MPQPVVRAIVRLTTHRRNVALCLHRVGGEFAGEQLFPELTQPASDIDEIISYFAWCPERLTVAFDDAYADAVEYVAERAPLHPRVDWLIGICAKKTIDRCAHTWDIWAENTTSRTSHVFLGHWRRSVEHGRLTIEGDHRLADDDRFLLASTERCREIGRLDNVELGNHTDHHLPMAWLDDAMLETEILGSERNFERAFGATRHLVLPFGCEPYVGRDDIARIAEVSRAELIWTVGSEPFQPGADDINGVEVRSRFGWGVNDLEPKAKALYIAAKCVASRLRRRPKHSAEVVSLPQVGDTTTERNRFLA